MGSKNAQYPARALPDPVIPGFIPDCGDLGAMRKAHATLDIFSARRHPGVTQKNKGASTYVCQSENVKIIVLTRDLASDFFDPVGSRGGIRLLTARKLPQYHPIVEPFS